MSFELFIARRYLRRRQGRGLSGVALIGIGGVFVGVGATLVVLSVMNGFHQELRNRILGVTPHILISRVFGEPVENHDSLIAEVRKVPGVAHIAPFIFTKTMIRSRSGSEGVIVRGIVPEQEDQIIDISKNMKQGAFEFSNNGIVLGNELAQAIGVGVGDEVSLASPLEVTASPMGMLPRAKKFRVNGVFDAGMYEYNTTLVYLSLGELQSFLNMGKSVSGLEVRLVNVDQAAVMARRLSQHLGYAYRVTDWVTRNRNLFTALRLEKVVTFIVLALIVLVAAFSIAGMLIMLVLRKTKEIGILRAMGANQRMIMRIFSAVGLLIGVLGTALGAAFGVVVSLLLNRYQLVRLPGDVYFIKNLPVQMQVNDFLLVCGIALIISYSATIYPAMRAAALAPVEAIRYE